ncbi:purine nucleoside transporter PunC [Ferrimonas lipolytica]|uniref:Bcr/CflA family efflux transporter n=1 Tax=Ferrimonas lipolytica TaxID=2724191 RepID=A0A6H1UBT0_9GAMM|nr:purine nucleoside transporter PunC [Ferrimonas lipolytica]QIZ76040.1 Bcr/CflA family multidrug efflux MFS transporter [Ferrimonas lipolytica]
MPQKITIVELIYLSGLSMLGFIATDMYLPVFKQMEAFYLTGAESIALSLSVFLAGMAGGQLLWGMASDRFGRRQTLLIGLAVYTLASIGLWFSSEIWQLLSLRFLQAIGVCAPAVIWQALVIDRYDSKKAQQIFATIMPLVALSPALAPQIGVGLASMFGWKSIFAALSVIGAVLLTITYRLPNTPKIKNERAVFNDITTLLSSRVFMGNVIMFGAASAAFFAFLTGMPEIMHRLGYAETEIGLAFVPQTIAFMLGGYIGKKWVNRHGDKGLLRFLVLLFAVISTTLLVVTQQPLVSIWPLLIPFCLMASVNGAIYPILVSRALGSATQMAATAAGLQNSLQITISFGASAVVAAFASQALEITGIAIAASAAVVFSGYLTANWNKAVAATA